MTPSETRAAGGAECAHLEAISDGSEPYQPYVGGTHPDEER